MGFSFQQRDLAKLCLWIRQVRGTGVTVTGSGASANGTVELFINGTSQGSVNATATGLFSFAGLNITAGDQLYATAAQAWNFETNGDTENWFGLGTDTSSVSGGIWTQTEQDGNGQMQIQIFGDGLINATSAQTRVLEVKARWTGAGSVTGSIQMWSAGLNGVSDGGGGDDVISAIVNTYTFNNTTGFVTYVFDLSIDHTGTNTSWIDGNPAVGLQMFIPGTNIGDQLEIESVRLVEYLDWNFDTTGETDEWSNGSNTTLTANGGNIRLTATGSGNIQMNRPFRWINSSYFTDFESRVRLVTPGATNIVSWTYLSNSAAPLTGGFTNNTVTADGNFQTVSFDLTQAPAFGNPWGTGGAATLNTIGGNTYSPLFCKWLVVISLKSTIYVCKQPVRLVPARQLPPGQLHQTSVILLASVEGVIAIQDETVQIPGRLFQI